jgi:hypothetical protein
VSSSFWNIEPILLFRIPFTPYFVAKIIVGGKRFFVLAVKEWVKGDYKNIWLGNARSLRG